MDTKKFFSFIYAINEGYNRNVDAMCNGIISIEHWAGKLSNKRKAFEICTFSCYIESQQFRDKVGIYYKKLKKSLINYEKSHWFDYDFDINIDRRKYFEQKYHIIRRKEIALACEFLEKLLDESNIIHTNDIVSDELLHYNLNYNKEQFNSIYNFLIDGKYLESKTAIEDIIYYFSGKGDKPQHRLKWMDKKVNLALFINTFCNNDNRKWVKAKEIFGIDGLRQSNGNTTYRKDDINPFEDLKDTLKKK